MIEGPKVILSKHPINPEGYVSPKIFSSPHRVEYAPIPIRERSIDVHYLPDSQRSDRLRSASKNQN